ncbi:MAG: hypothetical protein ABH854_02620 [Candidatus Diapherotrites archaeon]
MRKLLSFRAGGRTIHLPRLIGAFILFAALLMFVKVSAEMFESWDNLKAVNQCFESVDPAYVNTSFEYCQDKAMDSIGVYVSDHQDKLTSRQFWEVLLGPIVSVLIWLAVLSFGWMLYKASDIVVVIDDNNASQFAGYSLYPKPAVPKLGKRKIKNKK